MRRDFVRGVQIPKWNDQSFAAWEMRDKSENGGMSDEDATTVLHLQARPYTGGQQRPDLTTTFPAGARLRNYSEYGGPFYVNVGNDRRLRDDSGNHPIVPSGGYFAFSWENPQKPDVWQGDADVRSIEILQNGARAPQMAHRRVDGRNGDPAYAHDVEIPRVTDGSDLTFLARSDGSAVNILLKLDGGVDVNSQMGLGRAGSDKRDNRPALSRDTFLGYEQMRFVQRTAEKFAAESNERNIIGSLGAETWEVAIAQAGIDRNDGAGETTDTGAVDWADHDPAELVEFAGSDLQFQPAPENAAGQPIRIWVEVGYRGEADAAHVYYTTGGTSYPEGSAGVGKGDTRVAAMVKGPDGPPEAGGTPEWWRADLPALPDGTVLRYKIGVHQTDAPARFPNDGRDITLKKRMETIFEVAGFNAETIEHYPHNDFGETATGLAEGFHVVRTKAFLQRDGRASIFKTNVQTFYYDSSKPGGTIQFPANDGETLGGSTYGVVVRTDATVDAVSFNIADSAPGNDSAENGNGDGNWAAAREVLISPTADGGWAKEWRFDYRDIPASGAAAIRVRLREASSSGDDLLSDEEGWFTTLERSVNTGSPVNFRFGFPEDDGDLVGEGYVAKVLFDKSLAAGVSEAGLLAEFAFFINDAPLDPAALSILYDETFADHALAITLPNLYNGDPDAPHLLRAIHLRGDVTLSAARLARAEPTALPDADEDGLPDAWERDHGLDANNPNGVHGAGGDFDRDGISNGDEYVLGTNPVLPDREAYPTIRIGAGGALTFPALPGRQYQVIYTGDFGTWFALGDPIEVTEPSDAQITDPDPPDDRRFYALEVRLTDGH
ncbi:MAG: hypothetical protein R3F11_29180 [Verrucomicrobiales bacterium]